MNIRAVLPLLLAPVLLAQTAESKTSAPATSSNFQTFVKKLDRAPHFHGRQSRLMAELGGAMLNGGKVEEGEALMREALRKGKWDIETRYLVGSAYLRHKDTDKAAEAWNPLLRRGPESARTLKQISTELLDAGEVAHSERYMERVVALRQDGWVTRAAYSSQLMGKGHKDASMRWMNDAVRNDKDKEMATLWLAETLGNEGGKAVLPSDSRHYKDESKIHQKGKAKSEDKSEVTATSPAAKPLNEKKEEAKPAAPVRRARKANKSKGHRHHKAQATASETAPVQPATKEEEKIQSVETKPLSEIIEGKNAK